MAPNMNIGKESLRRWILLAQVDAAERSGLTGDELTEIKPSNAKVSDLEEAYDILKQSAIFFERELSLNRR